MRAASIGGGSSKPRSRKSAAQVKNIVNKDDANLTEARLEIGRYIERYYSFRLHQSLGGRTPDAAYAKGRFETAS
jgi:transposase InsO family protein